MEQTAVSQTGRLYDRYMKNRPLKSQFQIMIVLIIVSSLLATLVTYGICILLFVHLENKSVYPANHYERQLPNVEAAIRREQASLLRPANKEKLESVIPLEGMDYQVLDARGRFLYGTMNDPVFSDSRRLFENLNKTVGHRGRYVKTVPIFDANGDLSGFVQLAYQIRVAPADRTGRFWIALLALGIFGAPFLYVVLFIWLYSKMFANRMNIPLRLLMEAAKKIQAKDLDFDLDYRSENELGKLIRAFQDMKDELRRSLSNQWRLEQERTELVETLAHDLKTPLSVIQGYSEALLGSAGADPKKQTRYLAVIKENAEKGAALVKRLQYITDLETSNDEPRPVPTPVAAFVRQVVQPYELQMKRKNIRLTIDYQGPSDWVADIDAEKLERIWDNLISNSLRYTPEGGRIRITVRVRPDRLECEIANSGPPFSKKDLEYAFTKFYRGGESRKRQDGHAGLGLYIVKRLVEKLGGKVQAFNTPDGEACIAFDCKIPHGAVREENPNRNTPESPDL